MPLSYAAGLLKTYISGAASYLMILWWACLTLVLRMVILRTTRGQDRKRRFGSFCSWISTMVWRTAALSDEGGNRRLVQDLAADDVDRAHVGVPVGVGAEFVGRFGDEHLCRVVGDQQSPDLLFHQVRGPGPEDPMLAHLVGFDLIEDQLVFPPLLVQRREGVRGRSPAAARYRSKFWPSG